LDGSGYGLIKVVSWRVPEGIKKDYKELRKFDVLTDV
jgi:hypothetical protein